MARRYGDRKKGAATVTTTDLKEKHRGTLMGIAYSRILLKEH